MVKYDWGFMRGGWFGFFTFDGGYFAHYLERIFFLPFHPGSFGGGVLRSKGGGEVENEAVLSGC